MKPINVTWQGPAFDPSGYGAATRGYLTRMSNHPNVNLSLKTRYFFSGDRPMLDRSTVTKLMSLSNNTSFSDGISLQHLTPDCYHISPRVRAHVGMTTFETDSIPNAWQMPLRAMDHIVVFSNFNAKVFRERGINRPITVIPHGVDSNLFAPGGNKLDFVQKLPKDCFVFGSNFDWTARKNPEALLSAYFSTFKRSDHVCLALKVYHQRPYEKSLQVIKSRISAIAARHGYAMGKQPHVALLSSIWSESAMPSFYNSLDCYVLPSRGEGWSLTHAEAMSCGLPTIGINWGGSTDFMRYENSILIDDYKLETITAQHEVPAHYHGHKWADCNVDALAASMKSVFNATSDDRKSIGDLARKTIVENFTWEGATSKLVDFLCTV